MKKVINSLWAVVLALVLAVELLPASVLAANDETDKTTGASEVTELDTIYYVNPLYDDILSKDDLIQAEEVNDGVSTLSSDTYADTIDEAAEQLREDMVNRQTSTTIKYIYPEPSINNSQLTSLAMEMMEITLEHTGVSTEGDYLRWQYAGWGLSASAKSTGYDTMYLDMKFTITYYTSYEEEQEVTEKLENVFAQLNLGCESDYDRVCAIYDYICANVAYDYDHLSDPSYFTQFSAYGALVNGTAVCQGYAVLLYRMLLEADVDCRVIIGNGGGDAHAWNIVCLNGKYYNVDATWDAGRKTYAYFLLPDATFTSHERGSEYTGTFNDEYPMATSAYDASKETSEEHHTPGDWEVLKEATCTEVGLQEVRCVVCGILLEEEEVSALGHDYVEETTEPTCEDDGHVVQVCLRCEETSVKEVLPANGHSYTETEVVEPTCTEGGYTKYICSVCEDTYQGNHTDPLGHEYVEDSEKVSPTCVEQGEVIDVCERCEESYIERYIDPLGHDFVDGICTRCGWHEEDVDSEHHHDFQVTSEEDATCGEDGKITYACECGEIDEEVIPATGEHDYKEDEKVEPTCESYGYVSYVCSVCDDTYEEETPKTGHNFESEGVTVEATCTEDGSVSFACKNCGHEYEETVPAPGHDWVEQSDGTMVCARCGEVQPGTEPGPEEPEEPEGLEPIGTYDITEAVVTGIEDHYAYTGDEVKPVPTVTYNGVVLTEGVDYELSYIHDVEIGYASVAIVGIGDYYGDLVFHYTIASEVDKKQLQLEYNQDEDLNEDEYTAESWSAFVTALRNAKEVLENEDATQAAVNEALGALQAAREALEPTEAEPEPEKSVDKTKLQAEIAEDQTLTKSQYTTKSWSVFADALKNAQAVLADENATQEEVDKALATLQAAREALVLSDDGKTEPEESVDKTKLQAEIDVAKALNESEYTAKSWSAFADALKNAEAVLADENATQEEVDQALAALQAAEEALEPLEDGNTNGNHTSGSTGGTGDAGDTGSGSQAAKTGDTSQPGLWILLMAACAAVVVDTGVIRKRKSNCK